MGSCFQVRADTQPAVEKYQNKSRQIQFGSQTNTFFNFQTRAALRQNGHPVISHSLPWRKGEKIQTNIIYNFDKYIFQFSNYCRTKKFRKIENFCKTQS